MDEEGHLHLHLCGRKMGISQPNTDDEHIIILNNFNRQEK
jgi:hypothetical protein